MLGCGTGNFWILARLVVIGILLLRASGPVLALTEREALKKAASYIAENVRIEPWDELYILRIVNGATGTRDKAGRDLEAALFFRIDSLNPNYRVYLRLGEKIGRGYSIDGIYTESGGETTLSIRIFERNNFKNPSGEFSVTFETPWPDPLDDPEYEFDEKFSPALVAVEKNKREETEGSVRSGGFFKEQVAYGFQKDSPFWSLVRSTANFYLDVKFSENWKGKFEFQGFFDYAYRLRGRSGFQDKTVDRHEWDLDIRALYIDGLLTDWLRVKTGRQIISWSDAGSLLDVANPSDLRGGGFENFDERAPYLSLPTSKLPVAATKVTFFGNSVGLDLVAVHEIRSNLNALAGADFSFLDSFEEQESIVLEDDETPVSKPENTEYLARFYWNFHGGDMSLIYADVFDDEFFFDFEETTVNLSVSKFQIFLRPKHQRIKIYGASAAFAGDSLVFRLGATRTDDKAVGRKIPDGEFAKTFNDKNADVETKVDVSLFQYQTSIEFSGIENWMFFAEFQWKKILDYDPDTMDSKEESGSGLVAIRNMSFNNRLDTILAVSQASHGGGRLLVFRQNLVIFDGFQAAWGYLGFFEDKENEGFYSIRNQDRIFTMAKYDF